jgi:hypothetical protein
MFAGAVMLVLAIAAYWSVRIAWADHLSRSGNVAGRQQAARWLPTATLYDRLADKLEETGANPLWDLERAADRDPQNAARQLRVALRAELAGDFGLAERRLLRAAELSRLYQPRFLLAQYYYRRQNAGGFGRWSHAAFQAAYDDVAPLIDLSWRIRQDANALAEQALDEKPAVSRQFLTSLVLHGQAGAASRVASQLSRAARSEDIPALLGYCNLSLSLGIKRGALEVWNRLCQKRLLPYPPLADGRLLTNSDFGHSALAAGFDWHVERGPWMRSVRFDGGMLVELSGRQPETCLIAWQYVPAASGKRYRLRIDSRAIDTRDRDGMDGITYDLAGKAIPTGRSTDGSLIFTAPAEVFRLALMYQRPPGSARLEGGIIITQVRLEAGG